jgi:hypothetical protein
MMMATTDSARAAKPINPKINAVVKTTSITRLRLVR